MSTPSPLKFFHLKRRDAVGSDEFDEMVVQAKNARQARQVASMQAADEGRLTWVDKTLTTCREFTPGRVPTVRISSFNAG